MARSSKSNNDSSSQVQSPMQGNGGIMGSGVFGNFGSFVNCKSEDTSMYCNFVKFFNVLIMTIAILAIVYFIYTFASLYFYKNSKK